MLAYIKVLENNKYLNLDKKSKLLYFKAYHFRISQNDSLSFIYHKKALDFANEIKDSLTILASLSGLSQSKGYDGYNYRIDYLNKLKTKAYEFNNHKFKIVESFLRGNYYYLRDENIKASRYYNNVLKFKYRKQDSAYLVNTLNNLGALYNDNFQLPDSANYYYKLKLKIINNNKIQKWL